MTRISTSKWISNSELGPGLKWSFLVHAGLLFLVLVKAIVFPGHPLNYIPTLKVDIVDLPDTLKKDLQNPSQERFHQEISEVLKNAEIQAAKIKAEAAKSDEMALKSHHKKAENSIEQKNKLALNRIKSLSRIQDFESNEKPTAKVKPIKGNFLSPGTHVSGEAREAAEANYLDILKDRLQENWTLPSWLARQNLSAQVQIQIDARGHLKNLKWIKTSGNSQFDDAVKRAIEISQPFPFPPKDLLDNVSSNGILMGFPL